MRVHLEPERLHTQFTHLEFYLTYYPFVWSHPASSQVNTENYSAYDQGYETTIVARKAA